MNTILGLVVVFGIIVFSMVLHELAHGWTAYFLGDTTAKDDGRLTLNPLKHLDPFMSLILPMVLYLTGGVVFGGAKPVPVNSSRLKGGRWGMALVALAGPMMNFLIAFIAFLVGHFWVSAGGFGRIGVVVIQYIVSINLGFMVFNLIPIPPLDGSRVIYPLMPDFIQKGMDKMEGFGVIVIYILLIISGGFFSWAMNGAVQAIWNFFCFIVGA